MNPVRQLHLQLHRQRMVRRRRRAWATGNDQYPVYPAPRTPKGSEVGPPDFVGVGTPRSGTSWWFANIVSHPAVSGVAVRGKEVQFFSRFADRPFGPADIEEYHRFFPRPPGLLVGEWSPEYHRNELTIARLKQCGARKILFAVRDPVERAWSHMCAEPAWMRNRPPAPAQPHRMLRHGWYAMSLEALLREFDRDDVLIVQYERCLVDTVRELRATYEFLGLHPNFVPDDLDRQRARAFGLPTPSMPPDIREALTHVCRPHVERVVSEWPEIDVSLWPNFSG